VKGKKMLQKMKIILVCPFCKEHYQDEGSLEHGNNCLLNPGLEGCKTCSNKTENEKCSLKLIPIDFKRKKRTGRYCLSWKEKDDN